MHFHFSTVVWGPWHTKVFLDVNLPSLLAPDNLAAFAAQHQVTYRIFTSRRDVPKITSSPAFQRARAIVPFELIECPVENTDNPIGMHHTLWRRSIAEAKQAGAMILFVPPDVAWSNGAFNHIAQIAARGKKVIFITYVRVVSETCIPELRRRYLNADGVSINVPPRSLVELALQFVHPLALTYLRDSPNFPIHPELVLWSVPGEGFLMRVLVREMFAYDPGLLELNHQALPAHPLDLDEVHYITDSDDLFALSFAPLAKDIEWYDQPQRLDPLKVGSWWLTYDSPANDVVARHYFRIHTGPRTPRKWRRAELESDVLIRRLTGTREILRVLTAMRRDELLYAQQVLALALAETKLARLARIDGPVTLLIPRNAGMLRWLFSEGESLLRPGPSRKLVDFILDHALVGRLPTQTVNNEILTTLRGGRRRLTWRGDTPLIDDVPLEHPGFPVSQDWSYVTDVWAFMIDRVLPPSSGMDESRPQEKGGRARVGQRENSVTANV